MKRLGFSFCAVVLLMVCGSAFAAGKIFAGKTFEFHHDARMQHQAGGTLEKAYGYVYVATDMQGHGVIQVMFSNGSSLDNARFNARLKFLDADGGLIREESFSHRIEAAGVDGAAERRLSKLVDLTQFTALQVDFYLSDVPNSMATMRNDSSAFLRTVYSGD